MKKTYKTPQITSEVVSIGVFGDYDPSSTPDDNGNCNNPPIQYIAPFFFFCCS